MIETHPFGSFVPSGARYLLLGSFPSKEAFDEMKKQSYAWFYSNGRNQFWPIMEEVYGIRLQTRKEMQELFIALGMGIADIIYQCERKNGSNLDVKLTNIVYATEEIIQILENNKITKIFFTSRYVETKFRRIFNKIMKQQLAIELVTLPSPSPRYVQLTRDQKIQRYKELLPQLQASRDVAERGVGLE